MKDSFTWSAVIVVMLVVIGVPFLLRPAEPPPDTKAQRLVIITPHIEAIRFEMAQGFNRHRAAQGKPAIFFDWRTSGGGSDLRKQVFSELTRAAEKDPVHPSIGYDLFFGGGDFEFANLAKGIKVKADGKEVQVSALEPIDLPEDVIKDAFPEPDIAGVPLYHPKKMWVGAVLSSFGIMFNRDVLKARGLPEPETWNDLTNPKLRQGVALADPSHSGSITAAYNVILRRTGWTEGWALMRRAFANARYFTSSASKVPVDIAAGEAAMGMCIDFYGRQQAGAVGGNRAGYIDPRHLTAITPDPIGIIRGAPQKELANEFIAWLLSKEAQALWQRKRGTPGGPVKFELRRAPIRRDMYVPEETALWADQANPFDAAKAMPAGTPDYYRALAPITHAMAIDIHEELKAAWYAILDHPDHPQAARMLELFDAMPEDLTLAWPDAELAAKWQSILDSPDHPRRKEVVKRLDDFSTSLVKRYDVEGGPDKLLADRQRWMLFFRGNYRQVVELSKQ